MISTPIQVPVFDRESSRQGRPDPVLHSGRDTEVPVDDRRLGGDTPGKARRDPQPPLIGDLVVEDARLGVEQVAGDGGLPLSRLSRTAARA